MTRVDVSVGGGSGGGWKKNWRRHSGSIFGKAGDEIDGDAVYFLGPELKADVGQPAAPNSSSDSGKIDRDGVG